MIFKTLLGTALIGFIFLSATAEAYDLPKILPDEKISTAPIGASDWTSAELFEQKLKSLLAENENLPASSPERINKDKNLVFVAFYKDIAYFLDKYSVEIVKNNSEIQSWKQHIIPIGKGLSPKNAVYVQQKFSLQSEEFFNSLKTADKISAAENIEDKKFLAECFKIGYYYAFKKEIDVTPIFDNKKLR